MVGLFPPPPIFVIPLNEVPTIVIEPVVGELRYIFPTLLANPLSKISIAAPLVGCTH